jgi:hypothetical protein
LASSADPGAVTVPTSDVAALDAAVRALLDEPSTRAEVVAAARRQAADWPGAARAAAQLQSLYERVSPTTQSPA